MKHTIPKRPPDFSYTLLDKHRALIGWQEPDHWVFKVDLPDGNEIVYAELGIFSFKENFASLRETVVFGIARHFLHAD